MKFMQLQWVLLNIDRIIKWKNFYQQSANNKQRSVTCNKIGNTYVDFSIDNPVGREYIGQYVDFNEDDPTDANLYNWVLAKGEDGLSVVIQYPIYYSTNVEKQPAPPTIKTTLSDSKRYNVWNKAMPDYSSDYKYQYTCLEMEFNNGSRKS